MHFARGQKGEQSTLINANRWFPSFCKHFDASSAHKLSSHKLSLVGSQNYGCEGKGVALLENLDPADFAERPCERGTAGNGISKLMGFLGFTSILARHERGTAGNGISTLMEFLRFCMHFGWERAGNSEERNFKI